MKMSDIFDLPLDVRDDLVFFSKSDTCYAKIESVSSRKEEVEVSSAIHKAINNHDRLEQENVKMKEQRDTWSKLFHSENKENNRLLQENAELRGALNVLVYKDSWGNFFTGLHGDSDVTEIVTKLLNK